MSEWDLSEIDHLDEAIQLTAGYISMCWDPIPHGVFESKHAGQACEELARWIRSKFNLIENAPK